MKENNNHGFTLIEVLVALVVIAIALTAVLVATQSYIKNINYLRDKTLAQWVAMNLVGDLQTGLITPDKETLSGQMLLMKQNWQWSINSSSAENAVKQISIHVGKTNNSPSLSQITTFTSNGP